MLGPNHLSTSSGTHCSGQSGWAWSLPLAVTWPLSHCFPTHLSTSNPQFETVMTFSEWSEEGSRKVESLNREKRGLNFGGRKTMKRTERWARGVAEVRAGGESRAEGEWCTRLTFYLLPEGRLRKPAAEKHPGPSIRNPWVHIPALALT